jgi:hypothetical protein
MSHEVFQRTDNALMKIYHWWFTVIAEIRVSAAGLTLVDKQGVQTYEWDQVKDVTVTHTRRYVKGAYDQVSLKLRAGPRSICVDISDSYGEFEDGALIARAIEEYVTVDEPHQQTELILLTIAPLIVGLGVAGILGRTCGAMGASWSLAIVVGIIGLIAGAACTARSIRRM